MGDKETVGERLDTLVSGIQEDIEVQATKAFEQVKAKEDDTEEEKVGKLKRLREIVDRRKLSPEITAYWLKQTFPS